MFSPQTLEFDGQISYLEGVINLRIIDTRTRAKKYCRRFVRVLVPSFSLLQPSRHVSLSFLVRMDFNWNRGWRAGGREIFFSFLAARHEFQRRFPSLSSGRAFSLLEMHCSSLCRRLRFRKRNGIPVPAENRFPRRDTDGSLPPTPVSSLKSELFVRWLISFFFLNSPFVALQFLNSLSLSPLSFPLSDSREMSKAAPNFSFKESNCQYSIMQLHSPLCFSHAFQFPW